jgi:hypothetical protein
VDPFTWFLIALGVLIVGVVVWRAVRKPSRGVDEAIANRNRAQALGNAEYYGGGGHGAPHQPGHNAQLPPGGF